MNQNYQVNYNNEEIRNLIEMEAAQRNALEAYIKQLKAEVLQIHNPEEANAILELEMEQDLKNPHLIVDAPLPKTGTMDPQQEVQALQVRLEEERVERDRLRQITEILEAERSKVQVDNETQGIYALPQWIKELNVYEAGSFSPVRMRISKNPDNLEFAGNFSYDLLSGDYEGAEHKQSKSTSEAAILLPNSTSEVDLQQQEGAGESQHEIKAFALMASQVDIAPESDVEVTSIRDSQKGSESVLKSDDPPAAIELDTTVEVSRKEQVPAIAEAATVVVESLVVVKSSAANEHNGDREKHNVEVVEVAHIVVDETITKITQKQTIFANDVEEQQQKVESNVEEVVQVSQDQESKNEQVEQAEVQNCRNCL